MVFPIALLLVIPLAWLAARSARWAIGELVVGAGIVGMLITMRELRIAWPNLDPPLAFMLNPYLIATLGLLLIIGGAVGLVVIVGRRALGGRGRTGGVNPE